MSETSKEKAAFNSRAAHVARSCGLDAAKVEAAYRAEPGALKDCYNRLSRAQWWRDISFGAMGAAILSTAGMLLAFKGAGLRFDAVLVALGVMAYTRYRSSGRAVAAIATEVKQKTDALPPPDEQRLA